MELAVGFFFFFFFFFFKILLPSMADREGTTKEGTEESVEAMGKQKDRACTGVEMTSTVKEAEILSS